MLEIDPARSGSKMEPAPIPSPVREQQLRDKAREFEAVFIAQMLKHSSLTDALGSNAGFGGDAFAGMLVEQIATKVSEKGGFGLSDKIYEQLLSTEAAHDTDAIA